MYHRRLLDFLLIVPTLTESEVQRVVAVLLGKTNTLDVQY